SPAGASLRRGCARAGGTGAVPAAVSVMAGIPLFRPTTASNSGIAASFWPSGSLRGYVKASPSISAAAGRSLQPTTRRQAAGAWHEPGAPVSVSQIQVQAGTGEENPGAAGSGQDRPAGRGPGRARVGGGRRCPSPL